MVHAPLHETFPVACGFPPSAIEHDSPLRFAPSHCSPASIEPLPQSTGGEHPPVSKRQLAKHATLPVLPFPTRPAHVAPATSPPSHCSLGWFFCPSPHTATVVQLPVPTVQSGAHTSAPP